MSKEIIINNKDFAKFYANHTREETSKEFSISLTKIDRLRKQLNLPRKTFQYRNSTTILSQEQKEIIIGSLLGDGCLQLVGKYGRKNSKFCEVHSHEQYDLLNWKMNKLLPFSRPVTTKVIDGRKKENNKVIRDSTTKLINCCLETLTHPDFTALEQKWYLRDDDGNYVLKNNKRIKVIPDDLVLTESIIAVWYFDDGSNAPKHRQATFNTQSFPKDTCEILREKLQKFGINCNIGKNRNAYVINVSASSYLDLIELATKKLPSQCVFHKVDLSKYKPPNYSTRFQKKPAGFPAGF